MGPFTVLICQPCKRMLSLCKGAGGGIMPCCACKCCSGARVEAAALLGGGSMRAGWRSCDSRGEATASDCHASTDATPQSRQQRCFGDRLCPAKSIQVHGCPHSARTHNSDFPRKWLQSATPKTYKSATPLNHCIYSCKQRRWRRYSNTFEGLGNTQQQHACGAARRE